MKLIGIIGYAGTGKDTTAIEIKKHCKKQVCILHFADKLKELAYKFGWDGKKDKKGRKFLQILGTDVCRAYIDDYWILQLQDTLNQSINDIVIIPDVRFPNEAKLIVECGGKLVVVKRSNHLSIWQRILFFLKPKHRSEKYYKWIKQFPHFTLDCNCRIDEIADRLKKDRYFKKLLDK
jgi:hypothetical protein